MSLEACHSAYDSDETLCWSRHSHGMQRNSVHVSGAPSREVRRFALCAPPGVHDVWWFTFA